MKTLIALWAFSWALSFNLAASAAAELESPSKSVYQINPALDLTIIGVSAAGSLWAYAHSDELIHPRCPCDPGEVNTLDRGAIGNSSDFADRASDVTVAAAVVFPPVLDYLDVGWGPEFEKDLLVYSETLAVNAALVTLAKYTVQRPLPRTYAGDPSLVSSPRGYRSFYSGHTSVAMSALSTGSYTFTRRHPDQKWPWVATILVGASVATERVLAGRHFTTDVVTGAIMGTAIGLLVPFMHRHSTRSTLAFYPLNDGGYVLYSGKF